MDKSTLVLENPLWDYVTTLYGNKRLQGLLLEWQDNVGVNINVVLFMLWLAEQRKVMDEGQIDVIESAIESLHHSFVLPLRALRRRAAAHCDSATSPWLMSKKKILDAEIQAEQMVIATLYAWSIDCTSEATDLDIDSLKQHNLSTYLQQFSSLPSISATTLLQRLAR
ncbi:TIGR02444 family protein [Aurantivibrio plasticivorans]